MTTSPSDFSAGFEIRPLGPDDEVPSALPTPPADRGLPQWSRSLVATQDDALVGVGWIALAPVTYDYVVEVHVAPGHRRHGVGTALVAALGGLTEEPFPVRGRVMDSQPWRRAFAESLGCVVRMTYPGPWFDPTSAAGRAWVERQQIPSGYQVGPSTEIPRERLSEAWARYVEWAQLPFGGVRLDRVRPEWEVYADELDPFSSMVATDQAGKVVAFSLVTPDGWQGRTFVVAETAHPGQPEGEALVRASVAASLRVLGARGVDRVELEGHTTDAHSPALVASLPPGGGDPMELVELTRAAG